MRTIWIVISLLGFVKISSAEIHRVSAYGSTTGAFTSLQAAINFAANGDEIWFESVCTGPWLNCSSFSESVIVDKQLIIRGPGYFLGLNNIYASFNNATTLPFVHIAAGAEGTIMEGMDILQLQVSSSFCEIRYTRIANLNVTGASNLFESCYIQSLFPTLPSLLIVGPDNSFQGNFIGAFDVSVPLNVSIQMDGLISANFHYNTIAGGTSQLVNSVVSNNIFFNHQLQNIDGCIIFSNLFNLSVPVAPFDQDGTANDPCLVLCNSTNVINEDGTSYFSGGLGDTQWIPADFSPAIGTSSDGFNLGMYNGTEFSYRPSGLTDGPVIADITTPGCIPPGIISLPVSLFADSPTDTPVALAEYFIDSDPGIGNGILFTFTDFALGFLNLNVDISGIPPGTHVLGLRLIDQNGEFSLTSERLFEIKSPPVLPDVTLMEYLVNQDPGYGLGTIISTTPDDVVDFIANVILSESQPGFNQLMFRARDTNGDYGVTQVKNFYILPDQLGTDNPETNLISYFVDEDPGIGLTPEFPVSTADDFGQSFTIVLDEPGFQDIQLRVRDNQGEWSVTQTKKVYVFPHQETVAPELEALQYYIDEDPGYLDAATFDLPQETTFEGVFTIPLSGIENGYHYIFVRSKDISGDFSTTQSHLVYVMDEFFLLSDMNDDGVVNTTDLLMLIANMGCNSPMCIGDINQDGITSVTDLIIFITYYGLPGPPPVN